MTDHSKRRPSLENLMAGAFGSVSSADDDDFDFDELARSSKAQATSAVSPAAAPTASSLISSPPSEATRRPSLENLMAGALGSVSSADDDDFDFDELARSSNAQTSSYSFDTNRQLGDSPGATTAITAANPAAPFAHPVRNRTGLVILAKGLSTQSSTDFPSPGASPGRLVRKEKTSPREKKFFSKLAQSRSMLSMSSLPESERIGASALEGTGSSSSLDSESKNDFMSDIEETGDDELVDWTAEVSDEEVQKSGEITSPQDSFYEEQDLNPDNLTPEELQLKSELRKVEDLRFDTLPLSDQLEIIRSLEVQFFSPGEHIVTEGDDATGFYLILGPATAEVEVVKSTKGLITHLKQGKCFGEKFFISRREAKRTATIAAVTKTKVGLVSPAQFHKWDNFRLFLLMRTFPLIKTLPKADQFEMYNLFAHEEFAPGEFIVRQGDFGDKFYIIVEGSADVKELDPEFEDDFDKSISLTRLYEGHSFGEMALIFDEPRTASVVAVDKVSCFVLSKAAFREALSSAKHFHETMQQLIYEILSRREKRAAARAAHLYAREASAAVNTDDLEDALVATGAFGVTKFSDVAEKTKIPSGPGKQKGLKINKYQTFGVLGKGSYGFVYLVRNEENGKMYAMKTLKRQTNRWNNLKNTNEIRDEINIMKKIRHDHIVSLEEVIDDPKSPEVYLIQELLEGGPILPNEAKTTPLPVSQARAYFRDMLKGVRYLHSKGIVHRDLKPQNMLRTAQDRVKIADFGAAVFTGTRAAQGSREVVTAGGTPAFMAPEIYKITRSDDDDDESRAFSIVYSTKVDVWGLGATLYNMVVGQPPWMADNELELAATVRNMELTYPDDTQYIDPHLKNLLARMLDKNPDTRLSMDMVYSHDWVTSEGSEPLDDGSSSGDLSTRASTMPSTPSRQSSGSTSSLLSSNLRDHHSRDSRDSREYRLSRDHHHAERSASEMDMTSSGLSINLLRTNSHSRKLTNAKKQHMKESVMILADNSDDSTVDERTIPPSPGIAVRRSTTEPPHLPDGGRGLSAPSPLACDWNDSKHSNWHATDMSSASTIHSGSPDVDEPSNGGTTDFDEKKSLKSTKMTRMTSSNIITHTGELRKALKIIAPIVREEQKYSYDDYDSYGSDSDFDDDDSDEDVFERRSPPPGFVDPVLPSSLNPLEIRSKSNLDESKLELGISEDELLGKHSSLLSKKSNRNMIAAKRQYSSSFSREDFAHSGELSPRPAHEDMVHHGTKPRDPTDTPALPRPGSGRALLKDAASGLLQRGNSASKMTGKTMSFVLRQKQVQEKQLAAAAAAMTRKFSRSSNHSSDEEYCRTLSGGDDVDEELSKYSSELDDVVVMDDDDMEDMFNDLITPNVIPQIDLQLAPMIINGHGIRKLLVLKTWPLQSNPSLNLRYGLAENIVSRHTMEDRTTAIASMEEFRNRTSSKSSVKRPSASSGASGTKSPTVPEYLGPSTANLKASSGSFDFSEADEDDVGYISESDGSHSDLKAESFESPRADNVPVSLLICSESGSQSTPSSIGTQSHSKLSSISHTDFSFFGIYDGHGGTGAAETLQNELHSVFEKRLILNNSLPYVTTSDDETDDDLWVVRSLIEAVAIVDRQILTEDAKRVSEIESARKEMQTVPVDSPEEADDPRNMKSLRQNYLGGLTKAARAESSSCSFSGSTAVAMVVIRKTDHSSDRVFNGKTPESSSISSTGQEAREISSFLPPEPPNSKVSPLAPAAQSSVSTPRDINGHGVPNLRLPSPPPSELMKAFSFSSVDSLKGSRVSSGGYNSNSGGIRIVIGHVGDCRAVLSDGGTAVELTTDHRPCMPSEKARVEAAGGLITSGRVNGVLAVTRSIGDFMYKQFDPDAPIPSTPIEESNENGIWSKTMHVISRPDVVDFLVQQSHEFIVLASDGLWEALSIQQVVNFTRQRLYEHGDIQRTSIELIAKAENCGACDNTSVVIVCLNQQDRSYVQHTPGRKVPAMPRSYSLASDSSSSSKKQIDSWKMIKRHHSDILGGKGSGSGDSLGSLSYISGENSSRLLPVTDIDVTIDTGRSSMLSDDDEDLGL